MQILYNLHSPTPPHAPETEEDEGNAEDLTHVEKHSVLEVDLILFGVFNENAGSEDEEEAKAKEEASTHLLGIMAIEPPMNAEKESIAQGFVELSGMARQLVHALEDKGPRHICRPPDYLRIHKVAHTDSTSADGGNDGNVIEHHQQLESSLADKEPQGDHQAKCAPMTC